MSRASTALARSIGVLAFAAATVTAALTACTCGPSPSPPSTDCCESSAALTATSVRLFRHGSDELVDGFPVPLFFGAQGGQHWGFDLLVVAEGAGTCVDVDLELHSGSPSGPIVGAFSGGVRGEITADGIRTSQIVVFPSMSSFSSAIYATASAYGASRTVLLCPGGITCSADAGVELDAR